MVLHSLQNNMSKPRFRRRNTSKDVTRRDMVHNLVDILLEDDETPKRWYLLRDCCVSLIGLSSETGQPANLASDEGICMFILGCCCPPLKSYAT